MTTWNKKFSVKTTSGDEEYC